MRPSFFYFDFPLILNKALFYIKKKLKQNLGEWKAGSRIQIQIFITENEVSIGLVHILFMLIEIYLIFLGTQV